MGEATKHDYLWTGYGPFSVSLSALAWPHLVGAWSVLGQPLAFPGKGGEGTWPHSCTLRWPCKTQAAQSWLSQPPVPQFQPGCRQEPGVLRAPENSWTEGRATRNLALMGPELGSLRTKLDVPSMSRGPSASPLLPEHAIHAPGLLSHPFSSLKPLLCPAFPQLQRPSVPR